MADPVPYRTPRWVKITGLIVLGAVILLALVLVTGIGGEHGPRRHLSPTGDHSSPSITYQISQR